MRKASASGPAFSPEESTTGVAQPTLADMPARQRLKALAEDLAQLRDDAFEKTTSRRVEKTPGILKKGAQTRLSRLFGRASEDVPRPKAFEWNAPLDVTWAHRHPEFDNTLHVFHQEWHGIRAAAGYLPGHKLAIPAAGWVDGALMSSEALKLRPKAVFIHGWSRNAADVTKELRSCLPRQTPFWAVWHGNTAQFMNAFEIEVVEEMISFRKTGILTALVGVKPDLHFLDSSFLKQPLLNLPPHVSGPTAMPEVSRTALIPVPNDWRKNYFTNLFAASAAGAEKIFVTTPLPEAFSFRLKADIQTLPRPNRQELFSLLPKVGIVMNASLSECQPMTSLEAMAFGVPCVTPKLELGALDNHPYQKLAQVDAVDTLGPVVRATQRLFDLRCNHPKELHQMVLDYRTNLEKAAFDRLGEVLS